MNKQTNERINIDEWMNEYVNEYDLDMIFFKFLHKCLFWYDYLRVKKGLNMFLVSFLVLFIFESVIYIPFYLHVNILTVANKWDISIQCKYSYHKNTIHIHTILVSSIYY